MFINKNDTSLTKRNGKWNPAEPRLCIPIGVAKVHTVDWSSVNDYESMCLIN